MTADPTYQTKNFEKQGGSEWDVGGTLNVNTGGALNVESGGQLQIAGVDKTAALAAAVTTPLAGAAAGYKIARGAGALDGSNPTPIATGLATIVAAAVQLRGTAAPGDGTSVLTTDYTGADGTLNVYGWKNTGGTDPTLVASTGTDAFDWLAIGT